MSEIVVNNSFCELVGFKPEAMEFIKTELTYTNQEAVFELSNSKLRLQMAIYRRNHKLVWFLKKRIAELTDSLEVCLLKTRFFPSGLLFVVEGVLKERAIPYKLKDLRKRPEPGLGLPWRLDPSITPRYYQKEMVEAGFRSGRGVFVSCVGSGKTLIMEKLIYELDVPCLIISPSTDLKEQTYDSLVECFGNKYVEKISASSGKTNKLKPIRIVNIQTLAALNKKGKLNRVLDGIEMICIDEFHHVGAGSYTELLPKLEHIYFRFGFTGTFLRNDSKTLDMYGVLSDVLYTYPAHKAIAEGFLTPLEVKIHELRGKKGSNYQTEYNKNYCGNDELLSKILEIMEDFVSKDQQVLILVKQKDAAGKIIHGFLKEMGIENEYISGDDKKEKIKKVLKNFNEKTVKVLVGSTILGEGIDLRTTDHMIMAQGGKSEIAITQATGRAVRLSPGKKVAILHDFNFEGTKYMQKHLIERVAIYEKNFGAEIEII